MMSLLKSRSYSRRSAGVLLLVGVLAGVTVGGGVGVIAASSTKTVTVCANKKTNVLRYAKNRKCSKTETKGAAGTAGAAGAKGDTGAAGTAGASSPTGFTARSVCGPSGTTLCAVGVQGPGGGTIVYVDSTNEMPGYDYLEVAPTDASTGVEWSTAVAKCGTDAGTSCQTSYLSDAGTALNYLGLGTGRAATAAIVARHTAGAVTKASYAAGVADAYTTVSASDWFLPSKDELNEVCKYARNTGQAAGAGAVCTDGSSATLRGFADGDYWSSSELAAGFAWIQYFANGFQYGDSKSGADYVRPVRAF
jgi:hypothetical protein